MADPDDAELERLAREVEAGEDSILVPFEMLNEHDRPPGGGPAPNLYNQIQTMPIPEKVKLALRGNKDARTILIRDSQKMIRRFVMHNPRITDGEVITVARNRTADEELLRMISDKREWVKNYQIRLALVQNPKTPLAIAIKLVFTLQDKDMRVLAKSRNVPQAVAVQARRIVAERGDKGV